MTSLDPIGKKVVRSNSSRRAMDAALLGSVSLLALLVAGGRGEALSVRDLGGAATATAAAQQAATAAAQQAAAAAAQSQASMSRAIAALAAARRAQQAAAAAAAQSASSVPDGVTTGGLMPYGGSASNPTAGITADPTKWVGASLPTETVSGSSVTVNINQTQQKGIFYWNTFNVGANTTVNFNQASSDWIALNRVIDPSASPTKILGHINALGSVYLINGNGIIFGAGSQINVHTLVASSLDIGPLGSTLTARDNYFQNTGIANLNSFSVYDPSGAGAATTFVPGNVTVERGATITANVTTDVVPLGSSGSVYLFGANVNNSGTITAPTGEVGMVAARTIDLVPNGYSTLPSTVLGTDDNTGKSLPFRGTEFRVSIFSSSYNSDGTVKSNNYLSGTGAVTHDGVIDASRGIVIMDGDTVTIGNPTDAAGHSLIDPVTGNPVQGVISVDTAVDKNGMVILRAATSVTMNGVISSQPVDDGAAPLPASSSFALPYVEMTAQSSVTVGSTGLVSAPSAVVALNAVNIYQTTTDTGVIQNLFNQGGNSDVLPNSLSPQSVTLSPGATIDVSGLQNVTLPASYNFISFQPRAEFADMPLQRNGPLYGATLWIDIRDTGTRSDGTTWVGTPLADASGYVNKVGRSIDQLMTTGGSVNMVTGLTAGSTGQGSIPGVQTAGSVINVAGGNITFLPGMVPTTRLLGSDGHIYTMADADPNITYVGILGQFTVDHSHWNVTQTWSTNSEIFSPGYTQGGNAGALNVTTVNPQIFQGTLYFGAVAGERQISSGELPTQGTLSLVTPTSVEIGSSPSQNFTGQSLLTTILPVDTLSSYGLSSLQVTANDVVVSSGATLSLAPGGSFSVTAGAIDIAGSVVAQGGAINLTTDRVTLAANFNQLFSLPTDRSGAVIAANVFVEGTLDVSGRFVNDTGHFGTDASGPAFTNGGSISITTDKSSLSGRDTTGSILLASGSVLDASSGAYISPNGAPTMASANALAGNGGSISLAVYQNEDWQRNGSTSPPVLPTSGTAAVLELDGSLRAFGFAKNGSLTLVGADTIRIGGSLQPGETSGILIGGAPSVLPASLLNGGGFGSYTIAAIGDGYTAGYNSTSNSGGDVVVSTGVNLTLQQQNLSSVFDYGATPTGTRFGQQSSSAVTLLPDDQRAPVDLTIQANNVVLGTGTSIATDPKATITIESLSPDTTLTNPTKYVPATSVSLLGSITDHGGSVFINALQTLLGSQAVVDLSGTFVASSTFGLPKGSIISGTLLPGGTFTVEGGAMAAVAHQSTYDYAAPQGSYLVADAGARVDVSGYAGTIQVEEPNRTTSSLWSWSDAGTVSVDVNGFAWGGSFVAMGGRYIGADGVAHADPRANNGTFILGGGAITLRQDTTDVTAVLASFQAGSAPGSIFVGADQLAPFDTVYLYAGAAQGGAGRIFTDMSASDYGYAAPTYTALSIDGAGLNWSVANRLEIAAGFINASSPSNVQLSAPYLLFTGGSPSASAGSSTASSGASSFTATGQTIDIAGATFTGYGQVNLISSGDIRLTTPKVVDGYISGTNTSPTELSTFTGTLAAGGNILLSAQRIYPVSAVTFTIETPGDVTFAAPAGSNTAIPLSAGGGISVIANTIEQGGNLFAPLGIITLGTSATQSVTLESGSLTSVTLADTVVPYGATVDGTNWYYNANLNPLSAPPAKGLVLAGASVTRAQGSTIDLRGGGDLQAMEWIQGKGGSRDTLTTTPSGQTVYALVPSQDAAVAAVDIQFLTARSADGGKTVLSGDTDPLVGTQITIAGGGGIAAGTYTLYPAHYATLPGAMRVVTYGSNVGENIPSGTTLPDGTVLVTGYTTQSTAAGKQSSGQTVFAIQTSAVWQSYSEYSFTSANTYFANLATKQGNTPPPLPMDAGRLAVIAQQSIVLEGTVLAQPGQDSSGITGRGGELDISAPRLELVGDAQYLSGDIMQGYVGVDVTQLNGFESILIGGQRADSSVSSGSGASATTNTITVITPTATNVVVNNGGDGSLPGNALTAPEILLVAEQVGQWGGVLVPLKVGSGSGAANVMVTIPVYQPVAGTGTVTIEPGSIIETTGVVHTGLGRNYVVASSGQSTVTAASVAAALGGTLSSSGTEIDNADLANVSAFWNVNGNWIANSVNQTSLTYYANGGPQQSGRGALFVATNDPTLVVTGPTATGSSAPTLTINFAAVTSSDAAKIGAGAPTGAVSEVLPGGTNLPGTLILQGGDTTGSGQVTIGPNVTISTNTLMLQATATTNAITVSTTNVTANQVSLTAPTIAVGTNAPASSAGLVLAGNGAQFVDVQSLTLKTLSGPVTVYGDFSPGTANLTFDAAGIAAGPSLGSGATFTVAASNTITLKDTSAPSYTGNAAVKDTTLDLSASEIDLGSGPVFGNSVVSNFGITGFANVNMTASTSVVVKGPGSLALGLTSGDTVNLNVTTPVILVDSATGTNSQSFSITTLAGNVSVADIASRTGAATRPVDSSEIGGSLTITGANIDIASTIQAQAGTITLDAIGGNLELHTGAYLAAGGYKKTLVDVDTYVAGGKIVLEAYPGTAGGGNVQLDAGSVVDVAQPTGGQGYGGQIDVTALQGTANFAGSTTQLAGAKLLGSGGPGLGGSFNLDTQGAADLTALAGILGSGGITGSISIETHTGNLVLAQGATLTANTITLTADDPTWPVQGLPPSTPSYGQVIIAGTIDARGYAGITGDGSGEAGGEVGLYGQNAVVLTGTGKILASTAHSDRRGGDVTIGIDWYAGGNIDLQAGSLIDVSGGTQGGLSGGTVTLRAPLNGNNDVQIAGLDATIKGARSVTVQGFISIDTNGQGQGIDGSSLTTSGGTKTPWDGIIDPAGAVTSSGLPINFGSWTNVTGEVLNVTNATSPTASTYTTPPNITIVTSAKQTITGSIYTDPTGASFYVVTDPVTGTTFESSLQVTSINVTNGGIYTSAPTVTITQANGLPLPSWGTSATATPIMAISQVSFNTPVSLSSLGLTSLSNKTVIVIGGQGGTGTLIVDAQGNITGVAGLSGTKVPTGFFSIGLSGTIGPTGSKIVTGLTPELQVIGVNVTGGDGYSGPVNVVFSGGNPTTTATATAAMGAAVTITGVTKGYSTAADLPTLTILGSGGATASFSSQTTGLSGTTTQSDVFTPSGSSSFIPIASSDVFEGSKGTDGAVLTAVPNQAHILLFTNVLANFVEGNGIQGTDVTGSWGFSGILDRLDAPGGLVSQLGASVVHFQPGIDLVNSSSSINSGNITVASNWNLAAGTAGNLQTGTNPATNTTYQYFDPTKSYVDFAYRLATPWGSLEAGALSLRAAGDVNINASISDGFFQTGNYLDSNYIAWVSAYLGLASNSNAGNRVIDPLGVYASYLNNYTGSAIPVAPYQAAGNIASPTSQDLATADLFPNQLRVCTTSCSTSNIITVTAPASWSVSITAGADTSSANPSAVIPLASALAGNTGDVIVSNHSSYVQPLVGVTGSVIFTTVNLPTLVRTGTGSIDVAAARDVVMSDTTSPGVIYAAGVNEPNLAAANYSGTSTVVAGNPDGFFEPQVLAYGNGNGSASGTYYGPPTAAAFPEQGGDVDITAQRDIVGYSGSGNKVPQYYQPWLLSDAELTPTSVLGSAISDFGEGVFTPSGAKIASQTAWWIQYGSFQQGFLSAGGNVTVIAGRDLIDVSVSLPTTGRVSGGLSETSLPVTNIYGSGNMIVRAGQDILGGSFYEGSGSAVIIADGSIGQNGTVSRYAGSTLKLNDVPLLAVDTGQIEMIARGSISIAGVVNPAALHAQEPNLANPLETNTPAELPLYISTYGPYSKATLVADTGDLTITIAPTAVAVGTVPAAPSTYPASFEAIALGGNLITTGISQIAANGGTIPMPGIVLSESDHGTFDLVAQDNVDLTFGYPEATTNLLFGTPRPYISAGPSLIDTAFDPFQPNSGYAGAFSGSLLAHADDTAQMNTTARIYAATGTITGTGSYGARFLGDTYTGYLRTEINRPAAIYAGLDIVDLNVIVQNIHTSDVSTVTAGRNIYYTGFNNAGGLQVAGPGYFVVQAGGDIGPFLPASHDFAAQAPVQEGIASVGDSSTTPVGNYYVSNTGGSVGIYDEALLGPVSNPRRNEQLVTAAGTRQGADIMVLFGTKFGVDYQAVINAYIDPANAANVAHNYLTELQNFLNSVGIATSSTSDAWSEFTNAQNLPIPPVSSELKQVFVDQVFFAELKAVGISQQSGAVQNQRGYEVINAMFPSSYGYTANALSGGSNGTNQLVSTGDLNLLHGTIQTQQGGSVSLFGPGGSIEVGSLATEPNTALKLSDLGILTLGGGGINTFTDQSVQVNASRVLTTQGGDVLMWTSNGDLDAGRSPQTTLLTPALKALYNEDDYESVDLGGYVTGGGIGTLQASSFAAASPVYLLAPRGVINFDTAGGRSSGDIVVVAPVVLNSSNLQVQGTTSGVPAVVAPPTGSLVAGQQATGANIKQAEQPTGSTNQSQPSVFVVEVLGYGGGDSQCDSQDGKKKSDTDQSKCQ